MAFMIRRNYATPRISLHCGPNDGKPRGGVGVFWLISRAERFIRATLEYMFGLLKKEGMVI
jgi:hypothetical protein